MEMLQRETDREWLYCIALFSRWWYVWQRLATAPFMIGIVESRGNAHECSSERGDLVDPWTQQANRAFLYISTTPRLNWHLCLVMADGGDASESTGEQIAATKWIIGHDILSTMKRHRQACIGGLFSVQCECDTGMLCSLDWSAGRY